jgi:1-acyl-sn-glycerol-3-phosphate acyltransferase
MNFYLFLVLLGGKMVAFWIGYVVLFVIIGIFAPFHIIGRKNIAKHQNYIIVCNHKSNFDPILLDFVFKTRNIYLSKIELFRTKFSSFWLTQFGAIGFDREKGLSLSQTKRVFQMIAKKRNIGVFPEGTRRENFDDKEELKGGAGMFAIKTHTPIIPCYIVKKHKFFRKNVIIVGKPFEMTEFYGKRIDKQVLDEADNIVKNKILELKKEYEKFKNEKKLVKKLKTQRTKI